MRRPCSALVPLIGALALAALGCKGGITSPAAYREAAAPVQGALAAVGRAAETARLGSDPPEFGRNLETLLPPLRELQGALSALRVEEPGLLALHQALADAVDAHLTAVEGIAETVATTPLKDSKGRYGESQARFDAAVAAWLQALHGM